MVSTFEVYGGGAVNILTTAHIRGQGQTEKLYCVGDGLSGSSSVSVPAPALGRGALVATSPRLRL